MNCHLIKFRQFHQEFNKEMCLYRYHTKEVMKLTYANFVDVLRQIYIVTRKAFGILSRRNVHCVSPVRNLSTMVIVY